MADILIVEDDVAVRFSLQEALESMGHSVDVAENGAIGVDMCKAKAQTKPYDLVISDLIMPVKDGVEAILELRLDMPNMKIIAISGGGNNVDIMDTTTDIVGADYALTKPFSMADLKKCVNKALTSLRLVD